MDHATETLKENRTTSLLTILVSTTDNERNRKKKKLCKKSFRDKIKK